MSNQLSQVPVEVLLNVEATPVPAQLSQVALEVLRSSTPEVLVTERIEIALVMPV